MAKPANRTRASSAEPTDEGTVIVRDPTFVRITADDTVIASRSDEIHISFLVTDHDPISQGKPSRTTDAVSTQAVKFRASTMEVARVRMPGSGAFNMAMQIIERALGTGRVHTAAFRTAIETMLAEYGHLDVEDDDDGKAKS